MQASKSNQERLELLLASFALLCFWIFLFWPTLFEGKILAFRDAANWYGPTLDWTVQQIAGGQIPLWNDLQGLGANWVGEGTSTVFYPATWLLAINLGPFQSRLAAVIILHFLICFFGSYRSARHFQLAHHPALLAALCYTLSVPTLASHCNWPFLISTTWLPFALTGLWKMGSKNERQSIFETSISLSLMILGGDPQMVYHFGLLCIFFLFIRSISKQKEETRSNKQVLLRLSLTLFFVLGCCLIQLWPTYEASKASVRNLPPASAPFMNGKEQENVENQNPQWLLKAVGEREKLRAQRLEFSQPPWHLTTLIYGNFFGTTSRYHARWDKQIPSTDRLWNPTLYQGILPLILLVSSLFCRKPSSGTQETIPSSFNNRMLIRWFTLSLATFALGTFGWFGFGWIVAEIQNGLNWIAGSKDPIQPWLSPEFGGVFWMLSKLPFYDGFRYPGKLWTIASFSISILAAVSFQSICECQHRRKTFQKSLLFFLAVTFTLLIVTTFTTFKYTLLGSIPSKPNDYWLGMFHPTVAFAEMQTSLVHTAIAISLILSTFFFFSGEAQSNSNHQQESNNPVPIKKGWTLSLLIILSLDVLCSGSWVVQQVQGTAKRQVAVVEDQIPERRYFNAMDFYQNHNRNMANSLRNKTGRRPSYQRYLACTIQSMESELYPQFHLTNRIAMVGAYQTLYPAKYYLLNQLFRHHPEQPKIAGNFFSSLDITPPSQPNANNENSSNSSRFLIAKNWNVNKPPSSPDLLTTLKYNESIWLDEKSEWKGLDEVTVPQPLVFVPSNPETSNLPENPNLIGQQIRVEKYELSSGEIRLSITTPRDCILVVKRTFDPGWLGWLTPENSDQSHQIKPMETNNLFCGYAIPAGKHKIWLTYQPTWWKLGPWISLVSWLVLLSFFLRSNFLREPAS